MRMRQEASTTRIWMTTFDAKLVIRSIVIAIAIGLKIQHGWAQRVAWFNLYPYGSGADIAVDMNQNVYVTGGCLTIKYTSLGVLEWLVNMGGICRECMEPSEAPKPMALILRDNDALPNVYTTSGGYSRPFPPHYEDILTASFDYYGQTRWVDLYSLYLCPDYLSPKSEAGHDVALTRPGLVCVTGHGFCALCPPDGGGVDIVTLWYTPDGQLIKQRRFSRFANGHETGLAVFAGVNAEYVTGYSFGSDNCGPIDPPQHFIVTMKYPHAAGGSEWVRLYGPAVGDQAKAIGADVAADIQGNVYVTGLFNSDLILIKYSNEGELLWVFVYDRGGYDMGRAIRLDRNGDVLVAGVSENQEESIYEFLILKLSPEGRPLWILHHPSPYHYDNPYSGAHGLAIDILNNAYVTGPGLTMKISPSGELIWTTLPCGIAGGVAIAISPPESVYPAVYTTGDYTMKIIQAPGDVDGDGCVDDADLLLILMHFGETVYCTSYDLNGDGVVDDADLIIVLFNFGQCF